MSGDRIEIGVDVDSTSVVKGDKAFDNLNKRLRDSQGRFIAVGKAAQGAEAEFQRTTRATAAAEREIARATAQMQNLIGGMRGVAGLGGAVRGALAAFAGAGAIRSLMDTAQQMQRINMTLTAVTGSSEAAAREFQYVSDTADMLGQNVMSSAGAYARLLAAAQAANIPLSDSRKIFEGLTAAATTYGLTQDELEGALTAVQQIISKGRVQAEELTGQLGERLPGAFALAAEAMGMTTAELVKQMELGNVTAEKFVGAFGDKLTEKFVGVAAGADTTTSRMNELDNAFDRLKITIVESGFLDALTQVLAALTAFVQLEAVQGLARGIGEAFKWMADNAVLATGALAGIAVAFGWIGPVVAALAAVTAALGYLSTKTIEVNGETVSFGAIALQVYRDFRDDVVEAYTAARDWAQKWADDHPGIVSKVTTAFGSIGTALKMLVAGYAGMKDAAWAILQGMYDNAVAFAGNIKTVFTNLGSAISDAFTAMKNRDVSGVMEAFSRDLTAGTKSLEYVGTAAGEAFQAGFDKVMSDTAAGALGEGPGMLGVLGGTIDAVTTRVSEAAATVAKEQAAARNRALEDADKAASLAERRQLAEEKITASTAKTDANEKKNKKTKDDILKNLREQKKYMDDMDELARKFSNNWETIFGKVVKTSKGIEVIPGVLGNAMGDILRGGGVNSMGGPGGFKDTMINVMQDMQSTMAEPLAKAVGEKMTTMTQGLSSWMQDKFGTNIGPSVGAGIGTGMAQTAVGIMQGDAGSIGSGIGSAAGAILGSFVPGIGTALGSVIGSVIGGFAGSLFGGGSDWITAEGKAFEGTAYAQNVGVRVNTDNPGATASARQAVEGTNVLLKDFSKNLEAYVESIGLTMQKGTTRAVNADEAMKAITGVTSYWDVPGAGAEAEEIAARVNEKVATIMAIAGQIATTGGPILTDAQKAWREAQKKFSEENVAILEDLGFTVREIVAVKEKIRRELVQGFNTDLLNEIAQSGKASAAELKYWRNVQLRDIEEGRRRAMATAREIGGSTALVNSVFKARAEEVRERYREFLRDMMGDTEKAVITWADKVEFRLGLVTQTIQAGMVTPEIAGMQRADALRDLVIKRREYLEKAAEMGFNDTDFIASWFRASRKKIDREWRQLLNGLEDEVVKKELVVSDAQKSIISQAESMAASLRNAAKSVAETRAGLRIGEESPLSLQARLSEARRQFAQASNRGMAGDANAASQAASLAQTVLGLGSQVYGSSSTYANLFAAVEKTLGRLGRGLTGSAKSLEAKLQEDVLKGQTRQTNVQIAGFNTLAKKLDQVVRQLERQEKNTKINKARSATA